MMAYISTITTTIYTLYIQFEFNCYMKTKRWQFWVRAQMERGIHHDALSTKSIVSAQQHTNGLYFILLRAAIRIQFTWNPIYAQLSHSIVYIFIRQYAFNDRFKKKCRKMGYISVYITRFFHCFARILWHYKKFNCIFSKKIVMGNV